MIELPNDHQSLLSIKPTDTEKFKDEHPFTKKGCECR